MAPTGQNPVKRKGRRSRAIPENTGKHPETAPNVPGEAEAETSNIIEATREKTLAWWEWYGRIRDKHAALVQPRANYLQRQASAVTDRMEADGLPVRILTLKPRTKGSTTWFAGEGYSRCRRRTTAALILGGQAEQSALAWSMWQTYLGHDLFPGWGNTGSINAQIGKWSNGSTLARETAGDVHAAIGGTYQFLHITELGRWPNEGVAAAGDVLANVLKTCPLLPGTMVVMESTAEGDSGEFPDRWWQACPAADYLSGKRTLRAGDYVAVFAPWFEFADSAMRLTEQEKAEIEASVDRDEMFGPGEEGRLIELYARKGEDGVVRLGTSAIGFDLWEQLAWRRQEIITNCKRDWRVFDRDCPHSPAAAFTASGRNVFLPTQLDRVELASKFMADRAEYGMLDRTAPAMVASGVKPRMVWRVTPEYEAWGIIFEPPKIGYRYLVVADPATGAEHTVGEDPDRHSVIVLRAGMTKEMLGWVPAAVVARVKPPCDCPMDVLAEWMDRLSWHYGRCLVAFERNNSGLALYEALKALPGGPPPIYERETTPFRRDGPATKQVGWVTTEQSRRFMVEQLQLEVREIGSMGRGILVPCKHALNEFRKFVILKGKAQAARGSHDDDLFSIGIGLCLQASATPCAMEVVKREKAPWEIELERARASGRYTGERSRDITYR